MHCILRKHCTAEEHPHNTLLKGSAWREGEGGRDLTEVGNNN